VKIGSAQNSLLTDKRYMGIIGGSILARLICSEFEKYDPNATYGLEGRL